MKWCDLDLTYGKLQVPRTLIRVRRKKATIAEPNHPPHAVVFNWSLWRLRPCNATPTGNICLTTQDSSPNASRSVFCDARGVPLRASSMVRQSFQPLLVKTGLPRIRFYDLQHSAATLLFILGVHPKIVQELLGHSQIFVTMEVYSHILPTLQQKAMRQFHDALTSFADEREKEARRDLTQDEFVIGQRKR